MNENENGSLIREEHRKIIQKNRVLVNGYLNKVLWFAFLTGPAIALGIQSGLYKELSYLTCIIISAAMLLIALVHFLLLKWKPASITTSIFVLAALDLVIAFMAVSHVEVRLTWFLIPFLSIMLCEMPIYICVSMGNFMIMSVAAWFVTNHEIAFRNDFDSHTEYFANVIGGYAIESTIMFVAGMLILRVVRLYFMRFTSRDVMVKQKEAETLEKIGILDSMAEIYDNVNLISFVDNTEMSVRDKEHKKHFIDMPKQSHTLMNQRLKKKVMPDQLEDFLTFTDIRTVRSRLTNKKIISEDFIDVHKGWFRAQYITVEASIDGIPNIVIYTTRNVDTEKRREERLIRVARTDELTRLYNRRCYEEDLTKYRINGLDKDLVFFSVDINGLKKVNDSKGHAAGDELIKGAADCLLISIGSRGKIYRTGGDEFVAIVHTENPKAICDDIANKAKEWRGDYSDEMSMSIGYASHIENENMTIDELEKKSDNEMYTAKNNYYREKGIDRRRSGLTD